MSDKTINGIARDWPGKSQPSEHPALWHMLDVGAVAVCLLEQRPIAEPAVDAALAFLVALHDIGKISASFRAMLRQGQGQHWRHWEHSAAILNHHDHDVLIGRAIGGRKDIRKLFYDAVAGHHGGPRTVPTHRDCTRQLEEIGAEAMCDAAVAIEGMVALFPGASLDGVTEEAAAALSWKLNGLTVHADWIGSNTGWFAPKDPDLAHRDYWVQARAGAQVAIQEAGLYRATAALSAEKTILDQRYTPNPMQIEALSAPLPDGPALSVVEDATGAGKTEAALILAARMMAAGKANGLFFALPTMATANAMLARLEAATPALFDGKPTLALSHGRARLSDAFREIRGRDGSNPEDGPHCGRWLSDDRRRILLADVGVGTVDQALLSVLPTRFNGLRLRALADHVLIVDEAHSYEPYMKAQLAGLLTFQARLGGSAILMTATLPAGMKAGFVTAFQRGLKGKKRGFTRHNTAAEPTAPGPYPALTVAGKGEELRSVNPASPTVRNVAVSRLTDPQQVVGLIRASQARGAACIWIRNAVDDAIAAVEDLRAAEVDAGLLHARFAICDRLEKEKALQARFGKDGAGRAGRVLVATQVVEQSLDLDFDVMVSDLAPIGSLIQRAGRVWRHMGVRPAETRPVAGPHLHVLSPDPDMVEDARWLHQVLDKGAHVYSPPDMWRSARAVFDAGGIRAPEGLRDLIEAVHGDGAALEVPAVLKGAELEHEGKQIVEGQLAKNCLLDPDQPFAQERMQKVWDDEEFPTRLGVPQVTLALAVERQGGLVPYAGAGPDRWAMSEVQVSAGKFKDLTTPDQNRPDILKAKEGWPGARAKYTEVAPLGQGGQICEGLRYDATLGVVWE